MSETFVSNIKYKGEPCIKMSAGKYTCLIAPRIGSNILRLYDNDNNIELVNFNIKIPMKWLHFPSIICGMPTLFFPNRLDGGTLKTSDNIYHFPVNEEKLNNYIHGFVHTRPHRLVGYSSDNTTDTVSATTEFVYDENDEFYSYFPVKFTMRITYTLSKDGLHYELTIINCSDYMLPIGVGCHTSMKAPFVKHGKKQNLRIQIPVTQRCELDNRNLCTGKMLELSEHDRKYLTGDAVPVLHDIDNEMYTFDTLTLDNGRKIHGLRTYDVKSGKSIIYEVDDKYKFFILWNCGGDASFFCPEPISWMINAPNIDAPASVTGYNEIAPGKSYTTWQHLSSM